MIALADLAREAQHRLVSLSEIAERQDISLAYLEQLFGADAIRVIDVLGAVDETMDALSRGAGASGASGGTDAQVLTDKLWEQLSAHVYVFLHQTRLSDIIENQLAPCPAVPAFVMLVDEP